MASYIDSLTNRSAALDGSTFSGGGSNWDLLDGADQNTTSGTGLVISGSSGSFGTTASVSTDLMRSKVQFVSGAQTFWLNVSQNGVYPNGNGYEGAWFGGDAYIFAINGGAFDQLGSVAHSVSSGDYEIERTATQVILKRNGTAILTVTDSSEPTGSGNRKGLLGGDPAGSPITLTNFEFEDTSGAVTGTGALTSPSSQIAGSGTVTGSGQNVTGTGALTSPSSQIVGSGKRGISDAGGLVELTSPASIINGAAVRGVSGSGALVSPSSAISGAGVISGIAGLGALTSPSSQITGVGVRRIFGVGALVSPSSQIAGISIKGASGNGSLTSPSSQVSGAGTVDTAVNITGTGALVSPSSAISGIGVKTQHITGTGALTSPTTRVIGSSYQSTGGGGGKGKDVIVIGIGIW